MAIAQIGLSSDLSESQRQTAQQHFDGLGGEKEGFLDIAFEAISDAEAGSVPGSFGETDPKNGKGRVITINLSAHASASSLEGTPLNEAMHVVANLIRSAVSQGASAKSVTSNIDEHSFIYLLESIASAVISLTVRMRGTMTMRK